MRDCKFRGKRVDNGEWVYGDLIHREPDGVRNYIHPHFDPMGSIKNHTEEVISESVGQYTELDDKEKSEIFNGDIIDGSYTNPMSGELVKRCYLVVFENGCYVAKQIGKSPYGDTLLYFVNHKCKVIGNKFDNPSLLEVQP